MNAALVQAVRGCGMKLLPPSTRKFFGMEMVVDKHPVTVAVKVITNDERVDAKVKEGSTPSEREFQYAMFRVMLRVDVKACERLGLETGQELDRWIMRHEENLGALVAMADGYKPPLPGHRMALHAVSPADPWALHLSTSKDGRWRESNHLVIQAGR